LWKTDGDQLNENLSCMTIILATTLKV